MANFDINVNGTIADDSVTNAKLANVPEGTIKGRVSVGAGDPEDLTPEQASAVLDAAADPFVRTSALPPPGIADGDSLGIGLTFPDGGFKLTEEGGGAKTVTVRIDEVLSDDRILNITLNDADRILSLTGDAELSGTNTGDQDLSGYQTIAALAGDVRAVVLTGLSLASSAAVAATDTILAAFGKLQAFNDLFTTVGLAFARLANPSAVRYPRINADNTVTALTIAQLYTDLAATGFVARTGSALAFDLNATYNSPTSPGSASVTLDTTGAVAGVEVVGYFNHSTEPTWPAGITAVGTWFNSGLNVVRFVYIDASNISAVISNERPVSEWQIVRKSSATTRNSTTTLAADPTLSIPIAANQSVIIRGFITVTSAATPDFKYRLTGPATPSEVRIQCVHGAASGVTPPSNAVRDAYDSSDLVFLMTGTQSGTILVNMEVVNGANSGSIAFEWAQNTSDAGNTTVRTNSYLEYQYA